MTQVNGRCFCVFIVAFEQLFITIFFVFWTSSKTQWQEKRRKNLTLKTNKS